MWISLLSIQNFVLVTYLFYWSEKFLTENRLQKNQGGIFVVRGKSSRNPLFPSGTERNNLSDV